MTGFKMLCESNEKVFKSIKSGQEDFIEHQFEQKINFAKTNHYNVIYCDGSNEQFNVATAAEAFRLSDKNKDVKKIDYRITNSMPIA